MSYCRFGPDSDLYVVPTMDGYQCIACKLLDEDYATWSTEDAGELYSHFLDHRDAGHKVPISAIKRAIADIMAGPRSEEGEEILHRLIGPTLGFQALIRIARAWDEYNQILDELDGLNWPEDD